MLVAIMSDGQGDVEREESEESGEVLHAEFNGAVNEDQEDLRRLIWKSRHLLIEKRNALPPAARGTVCDIDVGEARPIAQRVRPVAPKFREKLADLIKGLLLTKIIRPSTSPWASPVVVIITKNGEDIRLCIEY